VNPPFFDPHNGFNKGYSSNYPATFPHSETADGGVQCVAAVGAVVQDGIGLEVQLTAPPGATGYAFDWNFMSDDYPDYVCSGYADVAAVITNGTAAMEVSVNSALVETCDNGPWGQAGTIPGNRTSCIGRAELAGTGFDLHPNPPPKPDEGAGTGWRTTTASAVAGQVYTIRFTIWDSTDAIFDSTVLFDNFRWIYD